MHFLFASSLNGQGEELVAVLLRPMPDQRVPG